MNKNVFQMTLLENATDSLKKCVKNYLEFKKGDNSALKSAIHDVFHFTEILLKHYLALEHPSLPKRTPKDGNKITVTAIEAIKLLGQLDYKINSRLEESVKVFGDHRNDVEHCEFSFSIDDITKKIILLIIEMILFDKRNNQQIAFHKELPEEIWEILNDYLATLGLDDQELIQVEIALSKAKKYEIIGRCKKCGCAEEVLVKFNLSEARCMFCNTIDKFVKCVQCKKDYPEMYTCNIDRDLNGNPVIHCSICDHASKWDPGSCQDIDLEAFDKWSRNSGKKWEKMLYGFSKPN